jgi:hypothetical protein
MRQVLRRREHAYKRVNAGVGGGWQQSAPRALPTVVNKSKLPTLGGGFRGFGQATTAAESPHPGGGGLVRCRTPHPAHRHPHEGFGQTLAGPLPAATPFHPSPQHDLHMMRSTWVARQE